MHSYRKLGLPLVALLLIASFSPGKAQAKEDLSRALDGGAGRRLTSSPELRELHWNPVQENVPGGGSKPWVPFSLCWSKGQLAIADSWNDQLLVFSPTGRPIRSIGSKGADPGQFASLTIVRCGSGNAAFLTADLGLHRVSFFDSVGTLLRTASTPSVPQIDIIGEFALADDGSWYDSWLGSNVTFGPYLTKHQWEHVGLARHHGLNDSLLAEFGSPVPYEDIVARRVLNRVFFDVHNDTLWVLTQGDATIRGFSSDGRSVGSPIRLPVYFRGRDPKVKLGEGHEGSDFLPNSMDYDPNVLDVAVLADSLFVTVRYRDWGMNVVPSRLTMRRMALSSIEVFNRHGKLISAFEAPGMVLELDSDGDSHIAIVTLSDDLHRRVYFARLPF